MKALPEGIIGRLRKVRQSDIWCRDILLEVKAEEDKLLEDLAKAEKAVKETSTPLDEESFRQRLAALQDKRQRAVTTLDGQMVSVKELYDLVDRKIQYLDTHTRGLQHMLSAEQDGLGNGEKKKKKHKKRRVGESGSSNVGAGVGMPVGAMALDPNEPVYCYCRRISFGSMVACENENCQIEWFHFGCVGLDSEPPDPWYCPDCRAAGFGAPSQTT